MSGIKKINLGIIELEKRLMLDASLPVIAGQVLWLDGDDASTVLDAEGDNAASGGAFSGQVQTWQDKSASGFHVTAAASTNRPTYNATGLNSNGVITFDGSTDWLRNTGASIAGDDYTMFVVFNRTTATGRDAVFEMGNGGSRNALFLNDPGAGSAGKINMYHNGTFYNPSSSYTTSAYTMFTSTVNTNAYTLTQNGASVGSGTVSTNRVATTGIYVGNDSSSGDELQGNIAEIIVYDRDLTADERHDIETYLASKWGLTITNAAPSISANTGTTLNEGEKVTLTTAMLSATDSDNSDSTLIYTITDVTDNGTLFRDANSNNTIDIGEALGLSSTFTQADIAAGYIRYSHNDSDTIVDAFSFTITDQLAVTTAANFNFTINPVLDLPVTSGAVLWLDASDASTIRDADGDAANSGSFNNGVQTWVNKATPGTHDAVQTTLADRPDYTATGINNMGSIAFDGLNSEFLNLGSFTTQTAGDIFVVLRATQDVPGSTQNTGFMGFGTNGANTHYAWTDGNVYDDFGSTTRYNIGNLPVNLTQSHIYNVSSATNSWIARQNGVVQYTSNSNTVAFISTAQLGRSDSNSYTFNGQIAEVIMFDRVLNTTERAAMESYLSSKWLANTVPTLGAAGPFNVNENVTAGTAVTTMVGNDVDFGQTLTYSIQSGNTGSMFAINSSTGAITFAGSPNYEALNTYSLVVRVTDNGTGNLYAERTVTININDLNESPTIATNTGATVNEGGNVVITTAMLNEGDPDDSGAGLTYTASSITNGHIEVNGVTQTTFTQTDVNSGIVRFVHDGSETTSASFAVSLADGGENGATPATGTFNITVNPVNDNPVLDTNTGATITEGGTVTITNGNLSASDADTVVPPSGWYNGSWQYRQLITIDQSYVNADLTNFTVLLTQANMDAGFWSGVKANGGDIVITAADGTTKLSRELVSINNSLQTMELYALLPAVSGSVNTSFYIYYGNASGAETNDTTAWTGNYAAVWHLNETGATLADSTSGNQDGTTQGTVTQGVSGIIGNAVSVNGSSSVVMSNNTPLQVNANEAFTYEAWYRGTGNSAAIISMMNGSESYQGYDIWVEGGNAGMHLINAWSGDALKVVSNGQVSDGQWHHIVVTYDGSKSPSGVHIYVDGVDRALSISNNNLVSNDTTPVTPFRIGSRSNGATGAGMQENISGAIDEVRFYDGVMSAAQIAAQYANTRNTPTFYSVAGRESYNPGVTYQVSTAAANGTVLLNGIALNAGSTFNQADINAGRLTYAHNGSETTTDSFQFTISDGIYTSGANTFNLTMTPVNDSPTIATNTGATVAEGGSVVITTAMLNEGDPDDSGAGLTYTASAVTNGIIRVNSVTQTTFTQADINSGLVEFVHNGGETTTASFNISLADGGENGATAATGTFNLTVTPVNDAPVIQGWTQVYSENFEGGATGWAINTTTSGGAYLSRFLGPFSNDGGVQSNSKTYALSGNQDYTVIEFDFYRMDSWDTEAFRIWINDTQIFSQNFTTAITTIPDGSSGIVSWTVTERTVTSGNAGNSGSYNDQIFRFTLTIQNNAASTVKIGFGSTTNQAAADEAWGVDNVTIYEADEGGTPGPFGIAENSANGSVVGQVTARDPENGTLTWSIIGGTGASAFSINSATGQITVANSTLLNYESLTSYTLQVRATDNGSPNLSDTETITINILDVPENTAPSIAAAGPFSLAENVANTTVVGTLSATDAQGDAITWSITGGNTDNIFSINASGQIRVNSNVNLNAEWDNQYVLTVQAQDNGFGTLSGTRNITINVTGVNEAPTFDTVQALLAADPYLRYNATTGNFYRLVSTAATYSVASTNAAAQTLYGVAGHIATVTSAAENTYVRGLSSVQMWLGGSDTATEGTWVWSGNGAEGGVTFWQGAGSGAGGSVQNGLYANWNGATQPDNAGGGVGEDFMVMLTGAGLWNDVVGTGTNAYVIEWEGADVLVAIAALQNGPYSVAENSANGTSVGFLEAFDIDAGDTLTYSATGGTGNSIFAVNSTTGEITVTNGAALNFEGTTSYTLDVRVQDVAGLFATRTVTINVTNVNETPVLNAAGPFTINENTAGGTSVTTMSASDVDAAQTLTYSIQSGNTGGAFSINAATGQITVAGTLDYETLSSYNLVVRVTDNGTGNLYAERTVTVNLADLNEMPVLAPEVPISIYENTPIGTSVVIMNGSDVDAGQTLTYTIQSGNTGGAFAINAATGEITIASGLDFETLATYNLVIRATDNGTGNLYAEQTLTLNIDNLNDAPTDISLSANFVQENSAIGTVIGLLSATDQEVGQTHAFTIMNDTTGRFTIVGNQLMVNGNIDYEAGRMIDLVIRADDGFGGTFNKTFTIDVGDENEFTSTPTPTDTSGPRVGFEGGVNEEDIRRYDYGNIVLSAISGDPAMLANGFYGETGLNQIVRENVTLDMPALGLDLTYIIGDIYNPALTTPVPAAEQANEAQNSEPSQEFTNIRKALEFLQMYQDQNGQTPEQAAAAATEAAQNLYGQFEDVLTYHEKRQERLREALMAS